MHRCGGGFIDGVVGVELKRGFAASADGDARFDFDGEEGWERLSPLLDACRNSYACRATTFVLLRDGGGEDRRAERAFPLGGRLRGGDGAQPGVAFEKGADDVVGGGGPQ